jgi:hypothetical protein
MAEHRLCHGVRSRSGSVARFGIALAVVARLVSPSGASAEASDAARSAGSAPGDVEQLKAELDATRGELVKAREEGAATKDALEALTRRVDSLQSSASEASAQAAPAETPMAAETARILPVNADNPGVSFVVDTALAADTRSSWQSIGYPDGWQFKLKNAELFVSAPIDPFLRGYASINGSSDQGFDVEEAALITTALPGGFTVKGGRFHADLGRFPHWHDEALPFVDRPPSIDRIIGGESGSEGVEVSWLAPLDQYVELTGGVYNAVGSENLAAINENGFFGRRNFDQLDILVRPHTYVDLTDTLNAEIGGTWVGVPSHSERNLFAVDFTLRHQPGTSNIYQGLVWGSEWMFNNQRFTSRDADGMVIDRMRLRRQGGYTYVEVFVTRSYSAGMRLDYSESPDNHADLAKTYSAFVTWKPSEFQRLRLQFDNTWGNQPTNQRFTLQWTAFIGSHSHGFAQR